MTRVRVTTAMAMVLWGLGMASGPGRAGGQCCGDCNGDGSVLINEVITAVGRALEGCQDDGVCDPITGELAQCNASLATCGTDLANAQRSLTQCQEDLARCQAQCNGQLLPATGQTTCWDANGSVIACIGTGQDGEFQRGAALSYTDNGDGTITDNNTRLMWEVKDDSDGLHDKDNLYSWDAALAFVRGLNAVGFAGHTDWRLPNIKELEGIVDHERSYPAVSPAFDTGCTPGCTVTSCSCTLSSSFYWSSTTYPITPAHAWYVNAADGSAGATSKGINYCVRAVRGGL